MTNGGRRQHFCVGNVPGVSRCRSTTAEDPGVHSQDAATATRRPSSRMALYIQLGATVSGTGETDGRLAAPDPVDARYLVGGPGWSGAGPAAVGTGVLPLSLDDPGGRKSPAAAGRW